MEVNDEEMIDVPINGESNTEPSLDGCLMSPSAQTSSFPCLSPLVVDGPPSAPESSQAIDDDYDCMRREDEEKIERYANLTHEDADAMDREYATFSKIPEASNSLAYRQTTWWRSYDGKLKSAKRKPAKPTTYCKYFLEFWSEHDINLLELSRYNPDYIEEIEKRKLKPGPITEDGDINGLDNGIKRIKIDRSKSQMPEAEWELPTFYQYKKQIEDMCKNLLICDSYKMKSAIGVIDLASVDGFVKTSLASLEQDISSYFRQQIKKSENNQVFESRFEKETPADETGFKKVVVSTLKQYDKTGIGLECGQCVHLKVCDAAHELLFDHISVVDQVMIDKSPQAGDGLIVKYLVVLVVDSALFSDIQDYHIKLKTMGFINHYLTSARVLINFKKFHLHEQIVNPKISSFSSGSVASVISPNVQFESFHKDAIQKAVDTVSINAPNCSSVCVIDSHDIEILKEIIVPITKSCFLNELTIIDPSKSEIQVMNETNEYNPSHKKKLEKLRIIITTKNSDETLQVPSTLRDIVDSCRRDYECCYINSDEQTKEWPSPDQLEQGAVEEMRSKIKTECRMVSDGEIEHIQMVTAAYENPDNIRSAEIASLREEGLKTTRKTRLKENQILIGTLPDLFNNDCLSAHFQSEGYYVAIVYNASSITDSEMLSLLHAGVEKLILIGCSARKDLVESNLMNRMVKEYEKDVKLFTSGSKCSVVSSFVKIESPLIKMEPVEKRSQHLHRNEMKRNSFDGRSDRNRVSSNHRAGAGNCGSQRFGRAHNRDDRFSREGSIPKSYESPRYPAGTNYNDSGDVSSDGRPSNSFDGPQLGHGSDHHRQGPNTNQYFIDRRGHRPYHNNQQGHRNGYRGHKSSRGTYRGNRNTSFHGPISIDNPMHPHYKPRAGNSMHGNDNGQSNSEAVPSFRDSNASSLKLDIPGLQSTERYNGLPPF